MGENCHPEISSVHRDLWIGTNVCFTILFYGLRITSKLLKVGFLIPYTVLPNAALEFSNIKFTLTLHVMNPITMADTCKFPP